ncbi:MAG: 4a-hydroxytetrahydrobiopterin dehydratase [Planctomycetes bacterium]|nr:4a-hydroxytetrahydrobiopterin dehydratase [Planctomycetota bacterium]
MDLDERPLAERQCIPCQGGVPPLGAAEVERLLARLDGWRAEGVHHLAKDFKFKNFAQALAFANAVGAIAEAEKHHPDIWFTWGKARIEIRTHKIDGLTESDFVLAAKIDRIP